MVPSGRMMYQDDDSNFDEKSELSSDETKNDIINGNIPNNAIPVNNHIPYLNE